MYTDIAATLNVAQNPLANSIPSRAEFRRSSLNAKFEIKIAIVNPIPVKMLPHAKSFQSKSSGFFANPINSAIKLKLKTPIGFPTINPINTATVTSLVKSENDIDTPAFASANKGKIRYPIHGCNRISSRSTGGIVSRAATSARFNALRSSVLALQCFMGG